MKRIVAQIEKGLTEVTYPKVWYCFKVAERAIKKRRIQGILISCHI